MSRNIAIENEQENHFTNDAQYFKRACIVECFLNALCQKYLY